MESTMFVWYLFIDQNSSDKVISGLVVKVVSEKLSNLKTTVSQSVSQVNNLTSFSCQQ